MGDACMLLFWAGARRGVCAFLGFLFIIGCKIKIGNNFRAYYFIFFTNRANTELELRICHINTNINYNYYGF